MIIAAVTQREFGFSDECGTFARSLVEDGVDPKLAQSLTEHLADEIDQTVATKEHVEMVVTREVQQLRVEMHEEFQRFEARVTNRLDTFQKQMIRRIDEMTPRSDTIQNQVTQTLDSQSRWMTTSLIVSSSPCSATF